MSTFKFDASKAAAFLINSDHNSDLISRVISLGTKLNLESFSYGKEIISSLKDLGNVDIHFFGSRFIGVSGLESNLDIFVDFGGKIDSGNEAFTSSDEVNFRKIEKALKESPHWKFEAAIRTANVPIVKAIYLPSRTMCDFSINNGVFVGNSRILNYLFTLQSEASQLIQFLKKWMESQKFEGFKRYSLCMLVLFYLQQKKLMPSVKAAAEVKAAWDKLSFVEIVRSGRKISDDLQIYKIEEMENYKNYTRDFFTFYSDFNFKNVISTYHGRAFELGGYTNSYPKFETSAIQIPGPLNQEKVYERIDKIHKDDFVKLCKASSDYLSISQLLSRSLRI